MFTPHFFKSIRAMFERDLRPPISYDLPTSDAISGEESHQEFMSQAQQIFVERGYEKVFSESILDGELLVFAQNKVLHLVYCLPRETYVTTIEVEACWEAQCRYGAKSSTVIAPRRYSDAAIRKAENLGIELL